MPKNKNLSKITNYLTADTDNGILSSNVSQTITGSLTVTGNLTAQQFIVSSSVTYLTQSFASGSHKFGDSSDDIHTFTGSLVVSGSANLLTVGSNILFVSSSGNVGIGTTSSIADGQVTIVQASGNVGLVINSSIAQSPKLYLRDAGGAGYSEIQANNKLYINSANVGIGTSSPGNKLAILAADETVNPTLGTNAGKFGIFNGTGAGTYGMIMGVINNGNSYIQVQRIDTTATAYNLLLQPSGGSVGIGIATSNPSTKLHIYEPLTNTNAYLTIQNNRARNAAVYTQTTNGGFYAGTSIGTDTFNYQIYDGVAGAARLTISSTGAATFASTVTTGGQLITSAGQTGGYVAASSGYVNETQTVSTNGTSYFLYKSTGTSNGSSSTIFNITGMSTTNGTYADIYAVAQKDATASGINTNLEVQINGQYMVGIQAGGTSATTVRNAFRVCRMDGSWIIIGTVRT
jgi:hypothetical protein